MAGYIKHLNSYSSSTLTSDAIKNGRLSLRADFNLLQITAAGEAVSLASRITNWYEIRNKAISFFNIFTASSCETEFIKPIVIARNEAISFNHCNSLTIIG